MSPANSESVGGAVAAQRRGGSRARPSHAGAWRSTTSFRISASIPTRMDGVVDLVLQTTRDAYPTLDVPFHSRWRHFVVNGDDRWAAIAGQTRWPDRCGACARRIRSGDCQRLPRCRRRSHLALSRSRRAALPSAARRGWRLQASRCSTAALFSTNPHDPLRVDARALANLSVADVTRGLQVSDANPLVGLEGRVELLRRLGRLVAVETRHFRSPRHAAARRLVRSPGGARRKRSPSRPRHPVRTAATARADLAVAADARRDSRLATAGNIRR